MNLVMSAFTQLASCSRSGRDAIVQGGRLDHHLISQERTFEGKLRERRKGRRLIHLEAGGSLSMSLSSLSKSKPAGGSLYCHILLSGLCYRHPLTMS